MEHNPCPNCGHDWTAHSAYILRQERVCEEQLENGYSLTVHYTSQNMLWYAVAFEGSLFVTQKYGERAIALCKQSITRRIKADHGELPMPEPIHTPSNFVEDHEEW
jgi:hypothetical protein